MPKPDFVLVLQDITELIAVYINASTTVTTKEFVIS
jgi:hypothetical protein